MICSLEENSPYKRTQVDKTFTHNITNAGFFFSPFSFLFPYPPPLLPQICMSVYMKWKLFSMSYIIVCMISQISAFDIDSGLFFGYILFLTFH